MKESFGWWYQKGPTAENEAVLFVWEEINFASKKDRVARVGPNGDRCKRRKNREKKRAGDHRPPMTSKQLGRLVRLRGRAPEK